MSKSANPHRTPWRLWLGGLRPRTLPASVAPVIVGAAAGRRLMDELGICAAVYPTPASCVANAARLDVLESRFWPVAILCAAVALLLQIAVNFANDYSDGIRGADDARGASESVTGKPQRLTASGLVPPKRVLAAAAFAAALACVCGLAAILIAHAWWLLLVGLAAIPAGWFYTGGRHPYGYAGLGELFVFLFFGLAATLGTEYAVAGGVDLIGWVGAVVSGLLSCALMMVNNLRDIDEDRAHGKRTLAVRLGRGRALALLLATYLVPVALAVAGALMVVVPALWRWSGRSCGWMVGVPPCAAGDGDCVTEETSVWTCAPAVAPSVGMWALLALAVVLIVAAAVFARALMAPRPVRSVRRASVRRASVPPAASSLHDSAPLPARSRLVAGEALLAAGEVPLGGETASPGIESSRDVSGSGLSTGCSGRPDYGRALAVAGVTLLLFAFTYVGLLFVLYLA